MRYIQSFQNDAAIQTAVDSKELGKPYVALNESAGTIDWNSKEKDYSKEYFTIEALEDDVLKVFFNTAFTMNYSVNGGEWESIARTGSTDFNKTIPCSAGDVIQFKSTTSINMETRRGMFKGNTMKFVAYGNIMSLTKGDNYYGKTFHADNWYCFQDFFSGSTGLQEAKNIILPNNITPSVYMYMFAGCTSLTTAPVLPAATINKGNVYANMFNGCSKLNYIKCLATNISGSYCTTNWLAGVSATGTFVKAANMSGWSTGVSGIPSGWTVINA